MLWSRTSVGVLRVDRLRRERKGQCNQDRCGESDQADSETAAMGARTSGTIGRSGG
jgi:hypothetical protein